jgi:hypothetical protein
MLPNISSSKWRRNSTGSGVLPNTTTPYDYAPNAASDATSYVLRATLETDHTALDNDIDGTVNTVACGDPSDGSSTTLYYCVQP